MLYSILKVQFSYGTRYVARHKRGTSVDLKWSWYVNKRRQPGQSRWLHTTWEDAYKSLEDRANPASLAVNFVGTF